MHPFTRCSQRVNQRLNQELEHFGPYEYAPAEICLLALLGETAGVAARNFDYFVLGKELYQKYGHYYFDFAFREGQVEIEGYNIVATLTR